MILLALLPAGLPQGARGSLTSVGLLNLLLGISGLVPTERPRLARMLLWSAYLAFLAGVALAVVLIFSG